MVKIQVVRSKNRGEELDSAGLEATRLALQNGIRALVVDLDKCLIRGYAGVPALRYLLKERQASYTNLLAYLMLALRLRLTHSKYRPLLLKQWRLESRSFQEQSLLFELRTPEAAMDQAVEKSLPELITLVRQPLLKLCQQAKENGAQLILATANSATFALPLARVLGIQTVLASQLNRERNKVDLLLIGNVKRDVVLAHLEHQRIPPNQSWLLADLDYTENDKPLIEAFGDRVSLVINP